MICDSQKHSLHAVLVSPVSVYVSVSISNSVIVSTITQHTERITMHSASAYCTCISMYLYCSLYHYQCSATSLDCKVELCRCTLYAKPHMYTYMTYVTVSVQCHCAHYISIRLYQYATTSLNYIRSTNNQPYFPSAHFFAPCPAPAHAFLFLTCNVLSPLHACICGHKQQCSRCIECGGSEICEICRECGGGSIREHKRQRRKFFISEVRVSLMGIAL